MTAARTYADWLRRLGHAAEADRCIGYVSRSALGAKVELAGPVGERNVYSLRPRGQIAAVGATPEGLLAQVSAILATGNVAVVNTRNPAQDVFKALPSALASHVLLLDDWRRAPHLRAILFEGEDDALRALNGEVASWNGPILPIQARTVADLQRGDDYNLNRLLEECAVSTNTAAAGGNASLMSVG